MKKLLLLIFLASSFCMNAQVTWPTYSVTPPTSGCDGVWKINCSSTGGACGMTPYTYTFTPTGCATTSGLYFSGDTLSIPLCAVPCDMALDNSSGQTCLAMTGGTTGISEGSSGATKIFPSQLQPGEDIALEFSSASQRLIQIFDAGGKAVRTISTAEKKITVSTEKWSKGMYMISIASSYGSSELNKIVIR